MAVEEHRRPRLGVEDVAVGVGAAIGHEHTLAYARRRDRLVLSHVVSISSDHLDGWDMTALDLLVIENVGNLVCPTGYDLGEDTRVALLSVVEGEGFRKLTPGQQVAFEWQKASGPVEGFAFVTVRVHPVEGE